MKVVVMGAGGIGRRHAQSLATSKDVTQLDIIDPQRKALKETAALIQPGAVMPVNYFKEVNPRATYDVAVVATGADERHGALMKIKDKARHLIIEKFLFNKLEQYRIDLSKNVAVVNCPRRAMGCFDQFKDETPTIVRYGMQGLLSNTVHFADLLCHLAGYDAVLFTIELDKPRKTKRAGYWDADGSVTIQCLAGKRTVGLCFLTTGNSAESKYDFMIDETAIDEERRVMETRDGLEEPFAFKYQSELTASYIADIKRTGACRLATYEQAEQWHLSFLDALRRAGWKKSIT